MKCEANEKRCTQNATHEATWPANPTFSRFLCSYHMETLRNTEIKILDPEFRSVYRKLKG